MEIEKPRIPLEVRYYIIAQDAAGFKQVDIVDLVLEEFEILVSQSAISKIISKYREEKQVEDRPRSGRPKILSEEEEKALVKAVEHDRTLTANKIFNDQNLNPPGPSHISSRTISRTLNSYGLLDSTDVIEEIPEEAIKQRLRLALKWQKENLNWERVVFSDESDLFPDKQGKLHYRRYKGERVDLDLGITYRWDPRKVKVWGAISHNGVGTLIRYNETVKKSVYIEFLQRTLLSDFPLLRGTKTRQGKYLFQHDNARPHTALDTKKFLTDNRISVLVWPSYSPDISIIENVWGFIKEELFKKNNQLETADDTWREIEKIWYTKVNYIVQNLYSSLPNRVQTILELGGLRIN